jgi:predicted RNA-binding protein with PIN domain
MPLLIDGHNLIGRLPDLRLDDPDDEAKLVVRLRSYCARTRKQATVVFDHGLPGGPSWALSGGGVRAVFASAGRGADRILRERIRSAPDPRGLTVVTSDRQVIAVAEAYGTRVIRSEEFALELRAPPKRANRDTAHLSPKEVDEWLELFRNRDQE